MNPKAGVWIRFGANLLDGLVATIPIGIIMSLVFPDSLAGRLFGILLSSAYIILVPVLWGGFTVGKRICGIRIRKVVDQEPPTVPTMLMRSFVAGIIYALTLGIGVIVSAFMIGMREDKRGIHDLIAGTEIVYD